MRGVPGKGDSAYLILGIRFLDGAQIEPDLLNSIRLVVFASSGYLDESGGYDGPFSTSMKQISMRKLIPQTDRYFYSKVKRNVVTH